MDQAAVAEAQDDGVGIVGREEGAEIGGDGKGTTVPALGADEHPMQMAAFIVAALDPQRHPLAEIVEFADLDRRAQRS
jgi:hypothetical protein